MTTTSVASIIEVQERFQFERRTGPQAPACFRSLSGSMSGVGVREDTDVDIGHERCKSLA
jgi:hypothetical protein